LLLAKYIAEEIQRSGTLGGEASRAEIPAFISIIFRFAQRIRRPDNDAYCAPSPFRQSYAGELLPVGIQHRMTYACHLTFDVDWAPDWMVDICRQQLNQKNVKGTFFVTHVSDIIADLLIDGHAVGIHPNLFAGSSQGDSVRSVFDYLLNILPQADMMRTHGLYQSSAFFAEIISHYPQIKTDFSLLTYGSVSVEKTQLLLEEGHIDRVNYNWEDDVAFNDRQWEWHAFRPWAPLHVFAFHPVHVALNSRDPASYRRLKAEIGERPLYSIDALLAGKYRNTGHGTESVLGSVLSSEADFISVDRWRTV
jgi:hypothetical protein